MSNNKFHKILSDTITLPLLPASNFKETNTVYYAVLEKFETIEDLKNVPGIGDSKFENIKEYIKVK